MKFIPYAIGLLTFTVYVITLSPSIGTGDSAELAIAIKHLGLAHPTGFPAYLLLAKLWTLIFPFGEFVWRLYVLNALLASGTIVVLFFILKKLKFTNAISIISCLTLAFGSRFWFLTSSAHPYFLSLFLIAMTIFITLKILGFSHDREKNLKKYLYTLTVFIAFGFGTHLIFILVIPFLIIYLYFQNKKILFSRNLIGPFLLMIFLTLILYSYIPLRADANPVLTWNTPQNILEITNYISQKDYSYKVATLNSSIIMSRLKVAFLTLLAESILVGAILTFIGIVFVMKKNKPLFFASLSLVIFNALLVIAYGNENDQFILYRYLLPRMFLGTVIMAYGLLFLQKYAKKYVAVFFIVPLLLLGLNFQPNNNRSNFIVSDFAENIFSSSVPNNSIILTSGDLVTMPLWYLQEVENKNRNITVIDTNLIPVEWYAKSLHEKYPKLAPKNFESIPHTERVLQFIEHNISKKPIFVFGNLPTHQQYQLIPHGLLHQIKMIDENASVENISKINKKLWDDYIIRIPKKDWKKIDPLVYEVTRIYDKTLNNLGVWYSKQQMFDEMVWAWKKALEINPGNIIVQENLENFKNRK